MKLADKLAMVVPYRGNRYIHVGQREDDVCSIEIEAPAAAEPDNDAAAASSSSSSSSRHTKSKIVQPHSRILCVKSDELAITNNMLHNIKYEDINTVIYLRDVVPLYYGRMPYCINVYAKRPPCFTDRTQDVERFKLMVLNMNRGEPFDPYASALFGLSPSAMFVLMSTIMKDMRVAPNACSVVIRLLSYASTDAIEVVANAPALLHPPRQYVSLDAREISSQFGSVWKFNAHENNKSSSYVEFVRRSSMHPLMNSMRHTTMSPELLALSTPIMSQQQTNRSILSSTSGVPLMIAPLQFASATPSDSPSAQPVQCASLIKAAQPSPLPLVVSSILPIAPAVADSSPMVIDASSDAIVPSNPIVVDSTLIIPANQLLSQNFTEETPEPESASPTPQQRTIDTSDPAYNDTESGNDEKGAEDSTMNDVQAVHDEVVESSSNDASADPPSASASSDADQSKTAETDENIQGDEEENQDAASAIYDAAEEKEAVPHATNKRTGARNTKAKSEKVSTKRKRR